LRLRALARRPAVLASTVLQVGDLHLDSATHEVRRGSSPITLSAKEFALLKVFMQQPGQVLSRRALLEQCWRDGTSRSNVVDTYVRYLRDKIDRPFGVTSLETVRGVGYVLRADGGTPVR